MIANKKQIFKLAGVVLTCAVISACSGTDVSNPPPLNSGAASPGNADFTKFVAIGDSLTAGYADGALYLLGQQNSFPSILAQQFAAADGVAVNFTQPLVGGNEGGLLVGGTPGILENRFVLNTSTEAPERLTSTPTEDVIGTGLNGTQFNNMGVPGAKSFHAGAAGYGNAAGLPTAANPYFVRFASSGTASMIGDAAAQQPSFYVMWIGNNDVLSYATSGGVVDAVCKPISAPSACDPNAITDPAEFAGVYASLTGAFTTTNPAVQGMLVNIPDVSTIPFFTTVPYNAIPLDQGTADTLNVSYAQYNAALSNPAFGLPADEIAKRTISFSAGQNAIVIEDETLTNLTGSGLASMRQATAADLILLPAGAYIGSEDQNSVGTTPPTGMPWGVGTPLADSDVLIPSEIAAIDAARVAFNKTIKDAADADSNLAFFDAAAVMKQLSESGIDFGTGSVNSAFATGGAFSLDGVHPTARGYAVIANEIISVINAGFGANVHKVDPVAYPTIFVK